MTRNTSPRFPALAAQAALAAALTLSAAAEARAGLAPNWEESGQASYYGKRFTGRRQSDGRRFDPDSLTAAHDTLPLGTHVLVTRQDTGDAVVVTITDRMPPKHVRIIDLSPAAAKRIGLIGAGVGPVTLTEAKPGTAEPEEVAEAPDEAVNPPPNGRRRTRHGVRTVVAHRSYYHARSAVLARR